jgi:hypothetical protein
MTIYVKMQHNKTYLKILLIKIPNFRNLKKHIKVWFDISLTKILKKQKYLLNKFASSFHIFDNMYKQIYNNSIKYQCDYNKFISIFGLKIIIFK